MFKSYNSEFTIVCMVRPSVHGESVYGLAVPAWSPDVFMAWFSDTPCQCSDEEHPDECNCQCEMCLTEGAGMWGLGDAVTVEFPEDTFRFRTVNQTSVYLVKGTGEREYIRYTRGDAEDTIVLSSVNELRQLR